MYLNIGFLAYLVYNMIQLTSWEYVQPFAGVLPLPPIAALTHLAWESEGLKEWLPESPTRWGGWPDALVSMSGLLMVLGSSYSMEQLRRHREVVLRTGQVFVTQVGCETGQERLQICTSAVPP